MPKYVLWKKGLALIVILLFISMSVVPSTARNVVLEKPSTISYDGNILYVGGSGPNNYTKIQDAIDAANSGDTVYVYNGTYYETLLLQNLGVRKSIDLIGEDKNSTILENPGKRFGLYIENNDFITVTGFTFKNYEVGIYSVAYFSIGADNHIIFGNIFNQNDVGIVLHYANQCTIYDNFFSENGLGIGVSMQSSYNTISDNIFSYNGNGINCGSYKDGPYVGNIFERNIFNNNEDGLILRSDCHRSIISNNIFSQNKNGIKFIVTHFNIISCNNFQDNEKNARIRLSQLNIWNGNYWDDWIGFKIPLLDFLPYFDFSVLGCLIDWNPAKEPYDIQ